MLLLALGVGETEINKFDVFFFNQFQHIFRAVTHLLLLQSRNMYDLNTIKHAKLIPLSNEAPTESWWIIAPN